MNVVLQGILKGALAVLMKILTAAASEPLMKWLFFRLAEDLVKRTDTPHDDKFLEEVKKAYEQQSN